MKYYTYDPENRTKKYIAVEDVLDVNDPTILWLYIPGFSGYELSTFRHIRSMKHYMKFPYGMLVRPIVYGDDPVFRLTNNNNERVRVRLSQLVHLAKTNPYAVYGYPRKTIWTDNSSRNLRCFVRQSIPAMDPTPYPARFTIIDDPDPDDKFKIRMKDDVIVPLIPLKHHRYRDDEFYGRDDMRIEYK